MGGFLAILT